MFPTAADEVTSNWLAEQLSGKLGRTAKSLRGFRAEVLDTAAQTSVIVRFHLEFSLSLVGHSIPTSVIGKFGATDPQTRLQFHQHGLYARELSFYREFGLDPAMPLPELYFSSIDPDSGKFAIVMEDLGTRRPGDFWVPSIGDVEVALEHLARFHAGWWQHARMLNARWLGLPEALDHFEHEVAPMLPTMLGVIRRKYGEAFTPYLHDLCQSLADHWHRLWDTPRFERLTLCHGDYHPNEMYFAHSDEQPTFCVADWQMACAGTPGVDVQRLLLTGLNAVQFVEHHARLVTKYHTDLTRYGVDYPRPTLDADLRRSTALTMRNWLFALSFTDNIDATGANAIATADLKQRLFADYETIFRHLAIDELLPAR
ncbi:MAG: phosphotransferase [Pseudomonadota bacterium]